jgi:ornithine--oxo-acid transaminase
MKRFFSSVQKSSKTIEEFLTLDKQMTAQTYTPLPVVVAKGKGVEVWDVQGRRFLDCISGFGTLNHGHCHPKISEAMKNQMDTLTMTGRCMFNDRMFDYVKLLTSTMGFEMSLLMNSGSEACETAVKMARKWGHSIKGIPEDQARVVFPNKNFWGRTIAAVATTEDLSKRVGFGPLPDGLDLVDFNDLPALENYFIATPNCAAYMFEPIQGEGGVVVPHDGYYTGVRDLCNKYNVLMIADEVQCGLGRVGHLRATDYESVKPDVLILAKALGGGYYPLSAVLADAKIMNIWELGTHGSTFSGNPLGSAVGIRSLEVMIEENFVERSRSSGEYVLGELKRMQPDWIKEVRGRGMWFAMEPRADSKVTGADVMLAMLDEGMLAYKAGGGTVRMSPPLIMSKENCDEMLEKTQKAFNKF